MKTLLLSSVVALLASLPAMAELPLKLELLAPKEAVVLKKEDLIKPGVGAAAPKVDITLTYRITNTGKEAIVVKHGGDESTNQLMIKGPGAIDTPYHGPMTADYRMGNPVKLGPGESKDFELKGLRHGTRNMSYWSITKAGDYEVTLKFITRSGAEQTTLTSNTAKISVAVK